MGLYDEQVGEQAQDYSRPGGIRVQKLFPIWDTDSAAANASGVATFIPGFRGEVEFFQNDRVSRPLSNNFRGRGFVSVHELFYLRSVALRFPNGQSGPDISDFYNRVVFTLFVNDVQVYQDLMTSILSGSGGNEAMNIPAMGRPTLAEVTGFGTVPVGAGESLRVTLNVVTALATQNNLSPTVIVYGWADKPLG